MEGDSMKHIFLLIIILSYVFAVIGAIIAKAKGKPMMLGVLMGALLNLMGILILCFVPSSNPSPKGPLADWLKKSNPSKLLALVFVAVFALCYLRNNKMFYGAFVAIVITVLIGIGIVILKKFSDNKTAFLAVGLVIIFVVAGVFYALLPDSSERRKCVKCGKNAIYSETGYCRSCYKEVEDAVEKDYLEDILNK